MKFNNKRIYRHNLSEKDLIGDLKGFPIEVVEVMLDRQMAQQNKTDVTVFQKLKTRDARRGGFHWSITIEGQDFWENVINYMDFELFFKKYPK